ncbi:pentapeptide repeat-containing protein [Streptomyces sp. NPDC086989]|uniref:pentapeptide repeat-containing protein n=1 Tax=Streptomyces sp. NPDC086989 TaxID=3365764 RepID=UPI0038099317
MRSPLPRRQPERRGLRLWPVRRVLVLAFAAAIASAAAVFTAGWVLLGVQGLTPEHHIGSRTLFDLAKLAFGVVAGAGALVALVVAYRRQRVDEDGALREATRLHTERFTATVSQLGDGSEAVRLGGVYALAGLADDAPTRDLRQTCIDVLCAYLRLHYTAEADLPVGDEDARHAYLAQREVRHTVIRLIRDHLRLSPEDPHSWQGHQFDFTTVTFDGGDFSHAVFSGGTVNFFGAVFSGGAVNFRGAEFSGGKVTFRDAKISDGLINFYGAVFSGTRVDFCGAKISGGKITFRNAKISGSMVDFRGAALSSGVVSFRGANVSAGRVNFFGAVFSGGTVNFHSSKINGGTINFHSQFSGSTVDFSDAEVSGGTVNFRDAKFSGGAVNFYSAKFSGGTVDFHSSRFDGATISFSGARFDGATVDLSTVSGTPPTGLIPTYEGPLPAGLSLPPDWYAAEA